MLSGVCIPTDDGVTVTPKRVLVSTLTTSRVAERKIITDSREKEVTATSSDWMVGIRWPLYRTASTARVSRSSEEGTRTDSKPILNSVHVTLTQGDEAIFKNFDDPNGDDGLRILTTADSVTSVVDMRST